jgi:hypothetical protein
VTLSALIRKGELRKRATATPATVATEAPANSETVAAVAVAVFCEHPVPCLTDEEEAAIRSWLAHIEETDSTELESVLDECRADVGARIYYLRRSEEVPKPVEFGDDDRRCCNQCRNLMTNGRCRAARRGEIETARDFMPVPNLPRRCVGYAPRLDDPDRRSGRERWPERASGLEDSR